MFADQWLWLIFVGIGLAMAIVELLLGGPTGFDLTIFGSVFILAGLIASAFNSWELVVILASVLCVVYIFLGRRYVRRWVQVRSARTNIDAVIGSQGVVIKDITRHSAGRVRVGGVEWRASADEDIRVDEEVMVTGVSGATLKVSRTQRGD